MRWVPSLLVIALLAGSAAVAHAQRARDLDRPYPGGPRGEHAPLEPAPTAPPTAPATSGPTGPAPAPRGEPSEGAIVSAEDVQQIGAVPVSTVGPRTFGDGRHATLTWDDPELDLEPRGWVHLAIVGSGSWLGGTPSFGESGGGALALALDILLVPSISLHLRLGAALAARADSGHWSSWESVKSATLVPRGFALLGAHAWQTLAVRAGIEIGEGLTFSPDVAVIGFALLAQVGVRFASGRVEMGAEVALDLREGSRTNEASAPVGIQEAAPRLGGYLGVTL